MIFGGSFQTQSFRDSEKILSLQHLCGLLLALPQLVHVSLVLSNPDLGTQLQRKSHHGCAEMKNHHPQPTSETLSHVS